MAKGPPFKPGDTYKKRMRMNSIGPYRTTTTVTIPREVITRKAEALGITPEEFVRDYQAVAQYNDFDGIFYSFEPVPEKQPQDNHDKGTQKDSE